MEYETLKSKNPEFGSGESDSGQGAPKGPFQVPKLRAPKIFFKLFDYTDFDLITPILPL